MANSPNLVTRSTSLPDLLATAVSDGTYEDVLETAKVDLAGHEAAATEVPEAGGQLWSNLVDDATKRVIQGYYKGVKLWSVADATERDALGSDDELAADDLLFQQDTGMFYTCASVDGASASTWTAISAAALASVLAGENSTGGTDIEVTNGDAIVGEDGGSISFAASTGLITTTTMCAGDPGTENGGITVSGATYQSSLKVSDLGGSHVAQFILHRHSTTLPPFIVSARSRTDDDTHAIVQDGDLLLGIVACGWDGVDYAPGGSIQFGVSGTPGSGDMPTRFAVLLSPDGSETLTERLAIEPNGETTIGGPLLLAGAGPTLQVAEAASTPGGDPGAGNSKFWAENTAPTTPKFTDDTNVAHTLAYDFSPAYHRVEGADSRGSTNTRIYRWPNVSDSAGSDITFTDSSTDGSYWTINTDGIYTISVSVASTAIVSHAINVASALSNTFLASHVRTLSNTVVKNLPATLSWTGPVSAGDLVWISTDTEADPDNTLYFNNGTIVRVR